jgi:Glycoside-hydrolase family GH114
MKARLDLAVTKCCEGVEPDNVDGYSAFATHVASRNALCAASRAANLRTLVLPLGLDKSLRYSCD